MAVAFKHPTTDSSVTPKTLCTCFSTVYKLKLRSDLRAVAAIKTQGSIKCHRSCGLSMCSLDVQKLTSKNHESTDLQCLLLRKWWRSSGQTQTWGGVQGEEGGGVISPQCFWRDFEAGQERRFLEGTWEQYVKPHHTSPTSALEWQRSVIFVPFQNLKILQSRLLYAAIAQIWFSCLGQYHSILLQHIKVDLMMPPILAWARRLQSFRVRSTCKGCVPKGVLWRHLPASHW